MSSSEGNLERRHQPPFLVRYGSVLNTFLLAGIAIMGLAMRSEITRIVQPLAEQLVKESYERQMAVERLNAALVTAIQRQEESNRRLEATIEKLDQKVTKIYEEAVPRAR